MVAAVQWVPLRGVLEVFLQEECLNSNQQATEVNWEQEVLFCNVYLPIMYMYLNFYVTEEFVCFNLWTPELPPFDE